jgi:hypothetical protein
MKVKNIFQGIAKKMLIDFDEIQSQIAHAGERGGQREQTLRDFLSKYLPKKYSVGTGQVIDKYGNISPQCDVVVYDAFNCPLILIEEGYQLFPVEAVAGVIEVKSILNATEIQDAVGKILKIKQLNREVPIAGFLFAYRSTYSGDNKQKVITSAEAFLRASNAVPSHKKIDLTCILAEGILRSNYGPPDWGIYDKSNWVEAIYETPQSIRNRSLGGQS